MNVYGTDHCDFIISSINLTNQLVQSGYDMIVKVFKIVNSIDRSNLLPYIDKIDTQRHEEYAKKVQPCKVAAGQHQSECYNEYHCCKWRYWKGPHVIIISTASH